MEGRGRGRGRGRARGRELPPLYEVVSPSGTTRLDDKSPSVLTGRMRGRAQVSINDGPSGTVRPLKEVPKRVQDAHSFQTTSLDDGASSSLTGRGANRTNRPIPQPNIITGDKRVTKKGTSGKPVKLTTNYFRLTEKPSWILHQYRVDMSPEEDCTSVRKRLIKPHAKTIGGFIFDGTVMYTVNKLQPEPLKLYSKRNEDGATITVTLKLVGDVAPGDYAYIQVFNIIIRKCFSSLKLQLLGRDFYDKFAKVDLRNYKLQIWPGYKTTIAQNENDILMVAEITHKVIRLDTVYDLLGTSKLNGANFHSVFMKDIAGQIVLTDYNNRTYMINDVDWKQSPRSTFPMNGEQVSYIQYYKKKYDITIYDHTQPLLVSLPKKKDIRRGFDNMIYLIPELCRMTGLTDSMRRNFTLMKTLSVHTKVNPADRINRLLHFNRRLRETSECANELRNWNMKPDRELVEVEARQLPPERIHVAGGISYNGDNTFDGWTKNLRQHQFFASAVVSLWGIISIRDAGEADTLNFASLIRKSARGMEFHLPDPLIFTVRENGISAYMAELERMISRYNPTMVVCVVKNNKTDVYNAIKKKCYIDRAVPCQVLTLRSLTHRNAMSIATKIAIQMNCKLGGAPWTVGQGIKNLMVVGYDVCHDPRNKKNSYGAMVASVNSSQTKYFNTVTQHSSGEEIGLEFCHGMKKCLQAYEKNNDVLPSVIIIYRDGVGEGQIAHVLHNEVKIVKETLEEIYRGPDFKLQFCIVSKRLNTRFFLNKGNPPPGTVVDDVVTHPNRYDFFLMSQPVRDGTMAPTSYNIIYDNTGLSPDQSQRMAYKFCHMYYNVSGQIRVPGPCQYAHKLAFMASQHLHGIPNQALSSVLFFL